MIHRYTQVGGALIAIGLLLIQLQGPWLYFKLQQSQIRSEIKQRIKAGVSEENLVTLKIAKIWETETNQRFLRIHDKEFRFDGDMYDIMRSEEKGDTTLYTCIHDVKESGLFAKLDSMVEAENQCPIQRDKRKKVEDLLSFNFISVETTTVFHDANCTVDRYIRESNIQVQAQDQSSPPPEQNA